MGLFGRTKERAGHEVGEAVVEAPAPEAEAAPDAEAYRGQRWQYETEVLSGGTGGDKLLSDLGALLQRRGDRGWDLVSCNLVSEPRSKRHGHLLIFKRMVAQEEAFGLV